MGILPLLHLIDNHISHCFLQPEPLQRSHSPQEGPQEISNCLGLESTMVSILRTFQESQVL